MSRWKIFALVAATAMLAGTASFGAAYAVTRSERAVTGPTPGQLGGGTSEAEYVAIKPCRIVDTRFADAGKLVVGETRSFHVWGDGPFFEEQGGTPDGCGIPGGAVAVEAAFTAVDAGNGFLRVWPGGQSPADATFMNYDDSFNVSNTGTVTLCDPELTACDARDHLRVRPYGNDTHLVIDVQGYYQLPLAAHVDAKGDLLEGNVRVTSSTRRADGEYTVVFDRDVATCAFQVTTLEKTRTASAFPTSGTGEGVDVTITEPAGMAIDSAFYLAVTC